VPHASSNSFSCSLQPDVNASASARRALDRFSGHLDEDLLERGALVITEVVTNSVQHAGLTDAQTIDLKVAVMTDALRVEVTDQGAGFEPTVLRPDPSRSGGWGLWLVDQLTDRWEVDFSHSTRVCASSNVTILDLCPQSGRAQIHDRKRDRWCSGLQRPPATAFRAKRYVE
jgi:anti-sigma regulatory factor (Ser/Thr protein kinase)